jgi:hypothetical protein
MAVRGNVTVECDQPECHAEVVLTAEDLWHSDESVMAFMLDAGWKIDLREMVKCPQCIEESKANAGDS